MLFLLSGVATVPEAWAATYYVNASTGDDGRTPAMAQDSATPWKTLTKALANVASGDDVQVASGTYDAALGESYPLALQDGVSVQGAGKATTTLSAPAGQPVIENIDTALSSGTTLSGFTLTHDATSGSQSLVHLEPISVDMAPVLDGNAFEARSDTEYGLVVDTDATTTTNRSFTGTISNNSFDGFHYGLSLSADLEDSGGGSEILSPTVTDAEVHGVHFSATSIDEIESIGNSTSTIHDNVVDQGFDTGIDLYYTNWPQASQVLASCNTVTNNFRGFVVETNGSSNTSLEAPDLGGGGSSSPGLNSFHDNAISDLTAETANQFARSNWWGTTNSATIQSHIDGSFAGDVDSTNFLSGPPSVTAANDLTASLSGDVITYTATLEGTGQCGCASSTFTAPTPDHTAIVAGSVSLSGAIGPSIQGEDPVEVWVGALGAGQVVTVTWMVQVGPEYQGDVSEQASLGCTQLAAVVTSDDPSTSPAGDPTIISTLSVLEIPTLQDAGLAILIVLLLPAGWFMVEDRRRRLLLMLALGLSLGTLGVRAATLSRLAVQGNSVRLALSDGTRLTLPKGHLEIRPQRLDRKADRGLSPKAKRALRNERMESRRLESLRPGQALVVEARSAPNGSVRGVTLRLASDLEAARAEVARVQSARAARKAEAARNSSR